MGRPGEIVENYTFGGVNDRRSTASQRHRTISAISDRPRYTFAMSLTRKASIAIFAAPPSSNGATV